MTIKERIERRSEADLLYFGTLIEEFKQTEMYDLLQEITFNEILNKLSFSNKDENSDQQLGELRALRKILSDIDGFVADKEAIMKNRKQKSEEKKEETSEAIEPQPKISWVEGGSI